MKNMEGRMREIEQSLHNVKLLLKEKVSQLKDQVSSKKLMFLKERKKVFNNKSYIICNLFQNNYICGTMEVFCCVFGFWSGKKDYWVFSKNSVFFKTFAYRAWSVWLIFIFLKTIDGPIIYFSFKSKPLTVNIEIIRVSQPSKMSLY